MEKEYKDRTRIKSRLRVSIAGLAVVFMAGAGLAGPGAFLKSQGENDLRLDVAPAAAVYGTPFSVMVTGLSSGGRVTVQARSTDKKGRDWESAAVFLADSSGAVDLSRQAPLSGSYSGVDVLGLLWSMQPANSPGQKVGYAENYDLGDAVEFTASDDGGRSAAARLERPFQTPGRKLVRVPLETGELRGALFHPEQGGPFPGVLVLAGSGGGIYEWLAQALASNGFAALTLAYFRYRDLPPELVEIPVEYFQRAVEWMKAQPSVRPDRVAVAGGSKGGELALLLASRFIEFQAVVAWTPAGHTWEGMTRKFFEPDYMPISSWSYQGRPLPFVRYLHTDEEREKEKKGELRSFIGAHDRSLAQGDRESIERARIPVEKIAAPLLLVSGTDDQTWPADRFCRDIVERLKAFGFGHELKHISHPGGGHMSFLPTLVTANRGGGVSGGSPQADARAGFVSWQETLAFLHRHLDR